MLVAGPHALNYFDSVSDAILFAQDNKYMFVIRGIAQWLFHPILVKWVSITWNVFLSRTDSALFIKPFYTESDGL